MSADDEPREGIRGTSLPDDAATTNDVPPNADPFGADGIRGDGLAHDADSDDASPDPDVAAEDGIRGDGLAEDA